ncbi:MAG: pyridoxal phosphate-dependent aminotransferase [Candidatus Coatesbacteria bacterium]|nr:pyridoxal phosphate-dependent aminotransferase [Candidatus Coatesbacteria bacterium]
MIFNKDLLATAEPPLIYLYKLAQNKREKGIPVIDLGQAIPDMIPDMNSIRQLYPILEEKKTHSYSADLGIKETRRKIAESMNVAEENLIITSGANNAFFQVLLLVSRYDDEIIVFSPFYFNHTMAIDMLGRKKRILEMKDSENEWCIDTEELRKSINKRTKAVVVVSPNNPTGAVFNKNDIERVQEICIESDIAFIYDEVYREFYLTDKERYNPLYLDSSLRNTFIIGSFSKTFGITGWRIGYLIVSSSYIPELLKIQDTIQICAPVPSQRFVGEILLNRSPQSNDYRETLIMRRDFLKNALLKSRNLVWKSVDGAFFGLFPYKKKIPSQKLSLELLKTHNIIVVPGAAFGKNAEFHLRISFGNADEKILANAISIVDNYIEELKNE